MRQLRKLAIEHGATIVEPDRKGNIKLFETTHVISNTINFEQYAESQALMIPVVTGDWLKTTITRGKIAQVRPYSPDPRMIFSSVVVTCADIPKMDKEAIIGATMALGGMEARELTRMTTHLVALSMDHPKCKEALAKNSKCKIVLPHW